MYDIGHYPGVIASSRKADIVHGEVYKILNHQYVEEILDKYEGCAKHVVGNEEYLRRVVTIKFSDGSTWPSWIYLFNRPVHVYTEIKGGDYVIYSNSINRQFFQKP